MIDWVDVLEDYPQLEKGMTNVSRTVKVLLSDRTTTDAFYGFHQDKWYYANNGKPIPKYKHEVIAWTDK